MRDLLFVAYVLALIGLPLVFRRPFLFVLAYAYIDICAPQRLSYFLLNSVPLSLIVFALALIGWLIEPKDDLRISPRHVLLMLLLAYCGLSTMSALVPLFAAEKWAWVWKALVFAIFLPFTLRTRLRIEALILTMMLSLSALVISGGIKTLAGGGGYGSLVILIDDNSGLFEGSIISTVAIAAIPLVLWLARHGTVFRPDWRVRLYAGALTFACLLIPIGTEARTGLICAAVLFVLMLRYAKRRLTYLALAGLAGAVALPFLPSAFTGRMETIKSYQADESAATRLAVWGWTWQFVKDHPLGGGFDVYRLNRIRYELAPEAKRQPGEPPVLPDPQQEQVTDAARAFHSSYFEMLGEQGYPGLMLWLLIHIGGIVSMERLQRRYRRREREGRSGEEWIAPLARALENAQIVYLVGSLFVGIAFQPFIYMLIGAQIGLGTYCARRERQAGFRPFGRGGAPLPGPTVASAG